MKTPIQESATRLRDSLIPFSWGFYQAQGWFEAIGIGADKLVIYARFKPPQGIPIPTEWEEWPVCLTITGGFQIGGT